MYADDLSLLSTSKDGLQSSLTSLHEYCHKWRLDINHKKSKVMVFSRGTQKEKNKYTINNIPLDIVKDYKYLGITLNSKNCSSKRYHVLFTLSFTTKTAINQNTA